MTVDLELDAAAFDTLGALVDVPRSPVSPWLGTDSTITDTARARLAELGVVDDTGTTRNLQPTLAALAAATATTTVRFVGAGVLVEYVAWVSADHGPVGLSATAEQGVFRLEDPAPTERVTEFLTGLVGRSPLRGLDLVVDVSIEDGLVLAALIDIQRRRILSGQAEADQPVAFEELRATLDKPPAMGFSLVDAISRLCDVEASRAGTGMTDSLARLAERGFVDVDSEAVRPAGPCAPLALHFSAITSILELVNAHDDGRGGMYRLGFTCLESGVSDLMTIEWIERGIHLETVSADTVVGYLDHFLRRPDSAVQAAAATGEEPEEVQTRPVSPQGISAAGPSDADSIGAEPETVTPTPPWRPTHVVPARGMQAWAVPGGPAVARLDPGVELQILGHSGGWAHIVCSNGWSAWVDGRAMEELPTGAPMAPPSRPWQVHPADRPARDRPVPGAVQWGGEQPMWRPTHVVPASGMLAWATPDPKRAPVARLDAGIELQLLERTGDWAHIVCSNGWSAWVNGTAIEPRPR
ncbi:hypothetical protein [Nocardia sp. NPDC050710]|uniref:hypothetical protein n=1 Tax=Nocardia sp. NPDC050710 TaxID=3157220 RepID=UPI003405D8B0